MFPYFLPSLLLLWKYNTGRVHCYLAFFPWNHLNQIQEIRLKETGKVLTHPKIPQHSLTCLQRSLDCVYQILECQLTKQSSLHSAGNFTCLWQFLLALELSGVVFLSLPFSVLLYQPGVKINEHTHTPSTFPFLRDLSFVPLSPIASEILTTSTPMPIPKSIVSASITKPPHVPFWERQSTMLIHSQ